MSQLAAAVEHYQQLLEGHRRLDPLTDTELRDDVGRDLQHARAHMEAAWLEHIPTQQRS